MRRSKSNPAKYARNYRAISQRQMSQYDHLDEEREMQRLQNILKHSEDHLKRYNDNDGGDDDGDSHDNNNNNKNNKKKAKKKKAAAATTTTSSRQNVTPVSTSRSDDNDEDVDDDETKEIERARALLRNCTDHLLPKPGSGNDDDKNTMEEEDDDDLKKPVSNNKKGKKRSRNNQDDDKEGNKGTTETEASEDEGSRKRKSTGSTEQQQQQQKMGGDAASTLCLSAELMAENQHEHYSTENPLVVLPPGKKKSRESKNKKGVVVVELTLDEIRHAKRLHKKTQRKLQQLTVRAVQKKKRAELYDKLERSAISVEEMTLLSSSSTLGKRVSKKEQLKKILQKERAGMELTQTERELLYRDRGCDADADGEEENDNHNNSDSDDDDDTDDVVDTSVAEICNKSTNIKKNDEVDASKSHSNKKSKTNDSGSSSRRNTNNKGENDSEENPPPEIMVTKEPKTTTPSSSSSLNATTNTTTANSFAAQMMASLSTLKATSEKQKEEQERKREQEKAERERQEQDRFKNAAKGAVPYRVKDPIVIQTAATASHKRHHQQLVVPQQNNNHSTNNNDRRRRVLDVERPEAVNESRYDLPVTQMEFEVIDAIRNNDVTIICGETGSGKSTQVPQLLYESGFTLDPDGSPGTDDDDNNNNNDEDSPNNHKYLIGITQPRRVAAISTAKRVCYEMGKGDGQTIKSATRKDGNLVAYQTRYETAGLGQKTAVKFMTDGILLQEIQSDLLLRKYSAIVLDECHERNLNCDILCGLIGLALPLRKKAAEEPGSDIVPLKLIIMSATLKVDDFVSNSKLFPSTVPFVVKIPGRTFPVTIHHSKITELYDYEDAAFQKVCKIHRKLPQGGVLVFLTGKHEIVRMVNRLQKALARKTMASANPFSLDSTDAITSRTDINYATENAPRDLDDDEVDGDLFNSDADDDFDNTLEEGNDDVSGETEEGQEVTDSNMPKEVLVLPLYSMMSSEEQAKVFASVSEGCRLIVVSTNIAETSITIPGISYVVDTGRQKCKNYDAKTGVASFDVSWISKAAANQRAGRSGRTGPGHCYRLYSSSMFSRHMDDFALPEVLTRPLEDVVLAMKGMKISCVSKFPFPTPPAESQIDASLKLLANIGCVDIKQDVDIDGDGEITPLGAAVATFPLGVRCGKMLLVAAHAGVLDYAISVVAALSEKNPFVRRGEQSLDENSDEMPKAHQRETKTTKKWAHRGGDVYAVMLAIGAYTYAGKGAGGMSERVACKQFCEENGLNHVIMERIQKIRIHLSRLVKTRMAGAAGVAAKTGRIPHTMKPPNKVQERLLLQVIVSGFLDNVAMLAPLGSIPGSHPSSLRSAYLSCSSSIKEPLFMDRNSVLFSRDARTLPQWVCYDYLVRKTLKDGTPIATMKNVTPVDASWLGTLAKGSNLLSLGGPVASPRPMYDADRDEVMCSVETKFGFYRWEIPPVRMRMHDALRTPEAKHSVHFQLEDTYRYFGRFLLEGKVLPDLQRLTPLLNDSPTIMTSKTPVGKVGLIVSALSNAGVDSGSKIRRHWAEKDNKFLFKTLKIWVKPEFFTQAKRLWIDAVKQESATKARADTGKFR